jgi:hypothetical protein
MLITTNSYGYSKNKKYITGRGFVDSLSRVLNSLKSSIGSPVASYISTNRDLIAKPLLGAIGSLAATGLTAGVPTLINHIMSKKHQNQQPAIPDDPKYKEILQTLTAKPVTNIIGSAYHGAGIKTF